MRQRRVDADEAAGDARSLARQGERVQIRPRRGEGMKRLSLRKQKSRWHEEQGHLSDGTAPEFTEAREGLHGERRRCKMVKRTVSPDRFYSLRVDRRRPCTDLKERIPDR